MSGRFENISPDHFLWKGISFRHDDSVLKIGTDALLLASWIPKILLAPKNILDVGTGSGVIAILMAHEFPAASVIGIDLEEKAVQLAQSNANSSQYQDRVQIEQSGLIAFSKTSDEKFDLMVSNPPFYIHHVLPGSGIMKSAKHAVESIGEWMKAMAHLLSDDGHVCLILPASAAFEWTREANANQLYCNKKLDIYSNIEDGLPKRSLLCFGRELAKPENTFMSMYNEKKAYTSGYQEWLGI